MKHNASLGQNVPNPGDTFHSAAPQTDMQLHSLSLYLIHSSVGSLIWKTATSKDIGQGFSLLKAKKRKLILQKLLTVVEFYRKRGYEYKNGIKELDDEQHYRLEKFRKIS